MIEYAALRLIWWLLLGILLVGFAVTDGYDLGIGAILRWIGRDDVERRMAIEAIEPHWEGHQVWFVLAGGAVFAAWPLLYAASFSGFYFAMLLVLLALILRPVGFAFRNRLPDLRWRRTWDWALTIAGVVPALVFGVAFGNLFLGVPFHYAPSMMPVYDGSFLALFHPFALLAGVVSLAMLVMHGANFAAMKIEAPVGTRARRIARIAAAVAGLAFAACGVWLLTIHAPVIIGTLPLDAPSNPPGKQVLLTAGAWLANFSRVPWLLAAPISALGMLLAVMLLPGGRAAFVAGGIAIAAIIFTAGLSLFPFLMPSSTNPAHGLTVWDASSSASTLTIMLIATVVLLPIVLAYTTWAIRKMGGGITRASVVSHSEPEFQPEPPDGRVS
jgi:cytochrome d ubiquinol oxidase subunit II